MPQTHTPAGDPETARIISLVSSITLGVDLNRYDIAEAAFAPSILVDYTSLWGGEALQTTPAALTESWRGLVPGFDATRHELSNIEVQIEDATAVATAFVDARHWLDGDLWRPIGAYRWTLEQIAGRWAVTSMTLIMAEEIGDRGLVAKATERAKAR
jgi:hypothetical protein